MSHCPHTFIINYYIYHKLLVWLLFCVPHFIRVTDCSIRVSLSFTGRLQPPCPSGCYTYIIMIIAMIEIYNILPPLMYLSSEKKTLRYQLSSPCYAAVQINNCLKRTFAIKVASMKIMDDFHKNWSYQAPITKSSLFVVNKDQWDTKGPC